MYCLCLLWRCISLHIERETDTLMTRLSACVCARLTWGLGMVAKHQWLWTRRFPPPWLESTSFRVTVPHGSSYITEIPFHCIAWQYITIASNHTLHYITLHYIHACIHTLRYSTLHCITCHCIAFQSYITNIHVYIHVCAFVAVHYRSCILKWIPILCAVMCFWSKCYRHGMALV